MKQSLFIFMVAGLLAMTGCKRNFEEINTNPNNPTEVSSAFLLTSAQKQLADHTSDEWWSGRRGMQLAQFWASNQYSSESRYQLRTSITNNYWIYFYAGRDGTGTPDGGGLQDLNEIIRLNTEFPDDYAGFGDNNNQMAVAKIMMAWTYQMMTDCWGAIPFSEALQGADEPSPAYDSQADVYSGLLAMLSEADGLINTAAAGPQGDLIYGGDMNQWKKFCNSLRVKVALRMSDVNDGMASSTIADAVNNGVFTSNADGAMLPYLSAVPNANPIFDDYQTRNDFAASNTMVDTLNFLGDPRISQFYSPRASDGTFVGEVYGLTEEDAALTPNAEVSQRSAKILAADFPGLFMDYASLQFALAESVERGYIAGNAADYYNEGIRASMQWWIPGVADADVDAYIAQASVDYATQTGAGATWKEVIGLQKWIALYGQGIEAWSEFRRLDYPALPMPAGGTLDGTGIPMRFMYPLDEQTLNGDSYGAAVGAQGADSQDTKLWWDVN